MTYIYLLFVVIILLFFIIKGNRNKGLQLRNNIEYFNVGSQSPPKVCKDDELNVGGVCLGITNCICPEDKILFEDNAGNTQCVDCKKHICQVRTPTEECCGSTTECSVSDDKSTCIQNPQSCKNVINKPQCNQDKVWSDDNPWINVEGVPEDQNLKNFCCIDKPLKPWSPCDGDSDCIHGSCEIVQQPGGGGVPSCVCESGYTGYYCNQTCGSDVCPLMLSQECCNNASCKWNNNFCENKLCKTVTDDKDCSGLNKDCCYHNYEKCSYNDETSSCGTKVNCTDCPNNNCGDNGYCLDGKCVCNDNYSGNCCNLLCSEITKCEERTGEKCCNINDKCRYDNTTNECKYLIKAGTALLNPIHNKNINSIDPQTSLSEYCESNSDCKNKETCDTSTNHCIPICKDSTKQCKYPKNDILLKENELSTLFTQGKYELETMNCVHNIEDSESESTCPYGPIKCNGGPDSTDCDPSRLCNPLDEKCIKINNEVVSQLNTSSCLDNRCEWIGYENNNSNNNEVCNFNYDIDKESGNIIWCCNTPGPTPPKCNGTQIIGESCDISKIDDLPCNRYYGIKDSKYYQCEENPEDQSRCSFLTTECKP